MTNWPCKNCKRPESEHQQEPYRMRYCEVEYLSVPLQMEIGLGNIVPELDWEWVTYVPMDNLAYIEYIKGA